MDCNFTIEGWVRQDGSAATTNYPSIISSTTWNNSVSFSLRFNNTGNANKFQVAKHGYNNAGTNNIIVGSKTYPYDTWNHFALVRTGASGNQTVTLYVNGESNGSASDNASYNLSYNNAGAKIGGNNWDGANSYIRGNLADLRVVKGTAVYTAEFTPPTAPLTAVTNTQLLLQGIDGAIIDKAQVSEQVKLVGNTKSSTSYTKFLSSSMYFDGTADGITLGTTVSDHIWLHSKTIPYTIEFWMYAPSDVTTRQCIIQTGAQSTSSGIFVDINNGTARLAIYRSASGSLTLSASSASSISAGQWHHVAFSVTTSDIKTFVDGNLETTTTWSLAGSTANSQGILSIGHNAINNTVADFTGYLSDVRITKGLARYTSNFTAPTAALQG